MTSVCTTMHSSIPPRNCVQCLVFWSLLYTPCTTDLPAITAPGARVCLCRHATILNRGRTGSQPKALACVSCRQYVVAIVSHKYLPIGVSVGPGLRQASSEIDQESITSCDVLIGINNRWKCCRSENHPWLIMWSFPVRNGSIGCIHGKFGSINRLGSKRHTRISLF